jgi:5-bromo-4-chloroindolyl phosphate hydrolysis protein
MKRFSTIAGLLAGISSGLLMLGFFFVLHFTWLITLVLSVVAYFAIYLIVFALRPKDTLKFNLGSGITEEMVLTVLKESEEKIRELEKLARQMKDEKIKAKIYHIIEIVRKIYENIRKDPEKMKVARQFLSYYFDTSIRIINKYSQLSKQEVKSPEITRALLKAENMLNSIDTAFDKQLARLLSNDVMDLDVEIETLEKTFKAEDLK